MTNSTSLRSISAACAFAVALGAGVFALPRAAVAATAHITHPIKVSECTPHRNNYMAGGFAPAYYPGGPYWGWPAVYGGYNYYQYPVQGHPTLSIDYHNATDVVMKNIEFGLLAGYQLVAEVRDVGTFSPGAKIQHQFGLSSSIFPLSTSVVQCVPLKIEFADGTVWKNPHLPTLRRELYRHP